jgi:hypothetical protein
MWIVFSSSCILLFIVFDKYFKDNYIYMFRNYNFIYWQDATIIMAVIPLERAKKIALKPPTTRFLTHKWYVVISINIFLPKVSQ